MKKLSLLLLLGAFVFGMIGCDPDKVDPDDKNGGDKAPTVYTQKTILEYFSGAWCGYCPDGRLKEEEIRNAVNANQFMAVVYHFGTFPNYPDNMDNIYDDPIDDKFSQGYPTGMINRVNGVAGSRTGWKSLVNAVLSEAAKCGLAINSSKSGDNLSVTVKLGVGPNDLPEGNYFLTVLLVEKEATGSGSGWDQRNYYSEFGSKVGGASHPYYKFPDPIPNYVHKNVVRGVLTTPALGMPLNADAIKAGALTTHNFTWDVQGLDVDMYVVAFISEFTDNISTSGIESSFIYNAQMADVGVNKTFD
jgi:hypothetical protein